MYVRAVVKAPARWVGVSAAMDSGDVESKSRWTDAESSSSTMRKGLYLFTDWSLSDPVPSPLSLALCPLTESLLLRRR